MKKTILLLFLFFQVTFSFSQMYYHFPTSNTTWYETYHDQYWQDHPYTYLLFDSDTVINGKMCHNLFRPYSYWPYDTINIGCIREDSLKKVFFYDYSSNYEFLLYDFSKSIGDTIFYGNYISYPFGYNYNYLIITNIDSLLIGINYRRRFYTSATFSQGYEVWIEGIGSYRSLLSPITPFVTCSCSWSLDCIKENDTVYCLPQTIVSINKNSDIPKYKVEIFPNPTTGRINIQIPQQFGQTKTLEIFDCIGQLQLIRSDGFSEIDISSLAKGLYFILLTNGDNERLVGKIIKE